MSTKRKSTDTAAARTNGDATASAIAASSASASALPDSIPPLEAYDPDRDPYESHSERLEAAAQKKLKSSPAALSAISVPNPNGITPAFGGVSTPTTPSFAAALTPTAAAMAAAGGSIAGSSSEHKSCNDRIAALESILKVWQKKYLTSQQQLLALKLAAEHTAFQSSFLAPIVNAAPPPASPAAAGAAAANGTSHATASANNTAADAAALTPLHGNAEPKLFQGMLLCALDPDATAARTALAVVPASTTTSLAATALMNALSEHALAAARPILALVIEYAITDLLVIAYSDGEPLSVYDMSDHNLLRRFESCLPARSNRVLSLLAIPNTTYLVGNTFDAVLVWDWMAGLPLHHLPLAHASSEAQDRSRLLYLRSFGSVLLITRSKLGDCFRLYSVKTWQLEFEWQTQVHTFDVAELTDGRIAWASTPPATQDANGSGAAVECFGVWTLDTTGVRVKVNSQTLPGPLFEDKSAVELHSLCVLPAINSVLVSYTLSPSFQPKERLLERYTFDGTSGHRLVSVSRVERATGQQPLRKLLPMPDGRILGFGNTALEVLEWSRPNATSVATGGLLTSVQSVTHDVDDVRALDMVLLTDGRVVACASDTPVKVWK